MIAKQNTVPVLGEIAQFAAQLSARAKSLTEVGARAPHEEIAAIDKFLAAHKTALPPKILRRLENYRADLWDKQIEEDAKSGELERAFGKMATKARREHKQGKTTLR